MELVPPSLLRSSNVPSSFWPVFQCLSWESISFHHLYVLYPLFLVLFHFLYYVLCSHFFPNTLILSLSNFVIPSKCLKNFIFPVSKRCSSFLQYPSFTSKFQCCFSCNGHIILWGHPHVRASSSIQLSRTSISLYASMAALLRDPTSGSH